MTGFDDALAVHPDFSSHDGGLSFLTGFKKTARHQFLIKPCVSGHTGDCNEPPTVWRAWVDNAKSRRSETATATAGLLQNEIALRLPLILAW
jgi:hypothetical protein